MVAKSNMELYDIESMGRLLEQLDVASRHHLAQTLDTYKTQYLSDVRECMQLCRDYHHRLVNNPDSSLSPLIWQQRDEWLHRLLDWLDRDTESILNTTTGDKNTFTANFQEITALLPPEVELIKTPEWWQNRRDDPWFIRTWKRLHRGRRGCLEVMDRGVNSIRKWFKQDPLPARTESRNFKVPEFLDTWYMLPVRQLTEKMQRTMLQFLRSEQSNLHQKTSHYITGLEQHDKLREAFLSADPELLNALHTSAQQFLPDLEEFQYNIEQTIQTLLLEFDSGLSPIREKLLRNWIYTGTRVLPNRKNQVKLNESARMNSRRKQRSDLENWQHIMRAENQDWKKDLELAQLQIHGLLTGTETINTIHRKIFEQILPTFTEPLNMLTGVRARFEKLSLETDSSLNNEILTANRMTIRSLRRDKIPKIVDTIITAHLIKSLENYISRLKYNIDKLPEKQTILAEGNNGDGKRMAVIPLKYLVLAEIFPALTRSHTEMINSVQHKMDKIIRDLSEIDQIVEYNFLAALDLLEHGESRQNDSHQVVMEGLQRAIKHFTQISEQFKSIDQTLAEGVVNLTLDFKQQLHELESNEKIGELQMRVARANTRLRLRNARNNLFDFLKSGIPHLLAAGGSLVNRIRHQLLHIGKITRLSATPSEGQQELARYLYESRNRLEKMPYVYQRLFRLEPLQDERFFDGRNTELGKIKNTFETWKNTPFFATALIGETGSGRTTLLHFARERIFRSGPVVTLQLDKTVADTRELYTLLAETFEQTSPESWEELEKEITTLDKPVVCIVENAHKLFLRTVNGFDALERFLLFISKTQHKVFWVLTFGLYSWNYLHKAIGLGSHFQYTLTLQEMPATDIESIILKRHRVSGYQLQFEGKPEVLESRKYKKLATPEEQQRYLKQIYFEQLNRQSQGNITVALLVWLLSIRQVKEEKLIIAPVTELDVSFLQQLPDNSVFTLVALLQHHMLTEAEHADIFRFGLQASSILLNNLLNGGLLTKTDNGYKIHDLMYRSVVRNLKINNIIYD